VISTLLSLLVFGRVPFAPGQSIKITRSRGFERSRGDYHWVSEIPKFGGTSTFVRDVNAKVRSIALKSKPTYSTRYYYSLTTCFALQTPDLISFVLASEEILERGTVSFIVVNAVNRGGHAHFVSTRDYYGAALFDSQIQPKVRTALAEDGIIDDELQRNQGNIASSCALMESGIGCYIGSFQMGARPTHQVGVSYRELGLTSPFKGKVSKYLDPQKAYPIE